MTQVPEERPAGNSFKPLRGLLPYLLPHWPLLAVALGALLVAAAAQLALPIALRYLIDQGLAVRDAATINTLFHRVPRGRRRVRHVRGAAFLHGVVARRAGRRRHSQCGLRARDPHGPELLRGHAHGRGVVAAHGGHDARAVDRGLRDLSITLRSIISLFGSLVLLIATSLRLTADHRDGDAVHRCPALGARAAAAPALARFAGSPRRRERARGGDASMRCRPCRRSRSRSCTRSASATRSSARSSSRCGESGSAACSPRSRRRSCSAASRSCSGSARAKYSRATSLR